MVPKLSKTNGDSKGKGKATTSFIVSETPFSLVSTRCVEEFEQKHQHRLVVSCLGIPNVVSLVAHQQIDYFLKLSHEYNDNLICVLFGAT